jgi:RNA polymerase sigma factor (sigma-70 family)
MRANRAPERRPSGFRRAPGGASWEERCSVLFEDLRKPARVMVARAYGGALSSEEVEDVYGNAWASTLAALRGRERRLDDDELRSYLLTAVANHARKEMRRRSRKPTSELREAHAQTVSDAHQPSPEERAVGAESGSVIRDVLSSLPARRRAVILLRYGWGLEPRQVCRLVEGLSPRAYRKQQRRRSHAQNTRHPSNRPRRVCGQPPMTQPGTQ